MTDVSISLPAKRRRGRPRKDGNLSRETTLRTPENPARIKTKNSKPDGIVGSMVYGVIEGSFDAGYLISVRIGNNETPFRGLVFQPKKFVPVTTDNDVAPQATMYQRREITVPFSENASPILVSGGFGPLPPPQTASKQTVLRPVLPYHANQSAFTHNLGCGIIPITPRNPMVVPNPRSPPVHPTEEAIQAFQVHGKLAEPDFGPDNFTQNKRTGHHDFMKDVAGPAFGNQRGETTNDMYNFHENLFSGQSHPIGHEFHREGDIGESVPKSLNLKLDLQTNYFMNNEPKSPTNNNLGYHHALVSGNPLLLPPEFSIGEPLDFMMGKNCSLPKSNKARQETSNEAVSSSLSGPYKLELATPQSTVNEQTNNDGSGGCITDMDFVLSDVVQGVEHQAGNVCETKNR